MRMIRVLLPISVLLLASGCGDDVDDVESGIATELPDEEARFVGEVTSVTAFEPITENCIDPADADPDGTVSDADPPFCTDPDNTSVGQVLIEAVPGEQEGDNVSLRVDASTTIFRAGAGAPSPATFDDLTDGMLVEAWVDGPVAESYPMQATASALLITE